MGHRMSLRYSASFRRIHRPEGAYRRNGLPQEFPCRIEQRRRETISYEDFLESAEALVKQLGRKQPDAGVPAILHGKPEAIVLFRNLPSLPATMFKCPADDDGIAELALILDLAMREYAPAGWKGDEAREKQVLNALFPLMARDRAATQAIFGIIKNQPGYG